MFRPLPSDTARGGEAPRVEFPGVNLLKTFAVLAVVYSHISFYLIDDLGTQALLGPFRGEPAVDRGALTEVLTGLSDLALARPDVVSADLNPLIVVDGRPVAVDALVELAV